MSKTTTFSRVTKTELPGMDSYMPKEKAVSRVVAKPAPKPVSRVATSTTAKIVPTPTVKPNAPKTDPLSGYKAVMSRKGGSFGVGFGGEPDPKSRIIKK